MFDVALPCPALLLCSAFDDLRCADLSDLIFCDDDDDATAACCCDT